LTEAVAGINTLDAILDDLAEQGWCVRPDFLPAATVTGLADLCRQRHAAGAFHRAGVGAGQATLHEEIRGDRVLWLDDDDPNPAAQAYFQAMETLRGAVNQSLYMGLQDLECHLALYPPGAGYRRHLDRFAHDDRRALTVIVYLNPDWKPEDGGQLRFWSDPEGVGESLEIAPLGGTLVTFLSDRYWHQVEPARRERLALTGWFRRR
jgi:SM-20-related protein